MQTPTYNDVVIYAILIPQSFWVNNIRQPPGMFMGAPRRRLVQIVRQTGASGKCKFLSVQQRRSHDNRLTLDTTLERFQPGRLAQDNRQYRRPDHR